MVQNSYSLLMLRCLLATTEAILRYSGQRAHSPTGSGPGQQHESKIQNKADEKRLHPEQLVVVTDLDRLSVDMEGVTLQGITGALSRRHTQP